MTTSGGSAHRDASRSGTERSSVRRQWREEAKDVGQLLLDLCKKKPVLFLRSHPEETHLTTAKQPSNPRKHGESRSSRGFWVGLYRPASRRPQERDHGWVVISLTVKTTLTLATKHRFFYTSASFWSVTMDYMAFQPRLEWVKVSRYVKRPPGETPVSQGLLFDFIVMFLCRL